MSFSSLNQMADRVVAELASMKDIPQDNKYPIMYFIENWSEGLVLRLDDACRQVYGKGLTLIKDETVLQKVQN